ncbi:hypothetical protein LTR53_010115 [Teratosphaeriaceae sp. CCFEE 6253]|nr:hypothetical protein LTR53_010115 [Teratosphaeriaceae sp. CCFEE 6253]
METTSHALFTPALDDLAATVLPALQANYAQASASVVPCPDLTQAPFHLAASGLSGDESIADIGGQPHLFPRPLLDQKYSLLECARCMQLPAEQGMLIGAGAGPFHHVGKNSELAPNLSWKGGYSECENRTQYASIDGFTDDGKTKPACRPCHSTDCALMMNLFGSAGKTGPVLKVTARSRRGEQKSFTECIRHALTAAYGNDRQVGIGGVFVIKKGRALYHVMPDFPPEDKLPFTDRHELNRWLTYHEFGAPMVCLTVFHSADPERLGLRMQHTHAFAPEGGEVGGHYHGDVQGPEEVEYEAYFNAAKTLYRIDQPRVQLKEDLHDD